MNYDRSAPAPADDSEVMVFRATSEPAGALEAVRMSGYSAQNLWRMRQFFETYRDRPKLSPALRELHPEASQVFKVFDEFSSAAEVV